MAHITPNDIDVDKHLKFLECYSVSMATFIALEKCQIEARF